METKIARINGVNIEYVYIKRDKECIVFVHGVGGDLTQFYNQANCFSKYSILLISLRGHGNSSLKSSNNKKELSLDTFVSDIKCLINELSIEKYHFVGNSAGGIIGYELLSQKDTGMLSLVTFGTAPRLKLGPIVTNLIVSIDKFMINNFSQFYFKLIISTITKDDSVRKKTLEMFQRAREVIPMFRGAISDYDYLKKLKDIEIPYLIIYAENDKEINSKINKVLDELSNNELVQVKRIKEAGHLANLDQPKSFNQVLSNFLQTINMN